MMIYDDTIPGLVWIIPILRILMSNHDAVFRFLFFLLILEGYNVKVEQHVLFPVGLGIYIYILSPQVSGSFTLTLKRMKTDETSLCVYGFMLIHEYGFVEIFI